MTRKSFTQTRKLVEIGGLVVLGVRVPGVREKLIPRDFKPPIIQCTHKNMSAANRNVQHFMAFRSILFTKLQERSMLTNYKLQSMNSVVFSPPDSH